LRVITGIAKGKRLKAPPGMTTRPITDMIKEALFNVISYGVEESMFLDLFAGSGSIGIEALSRGAEKVIFIDRDARAVRVIRENLENCGFERDKFEVYRSDVFKSVDILEKRKQKFDLIYIDPPFINEDIFGRILYRIDKADIIDSRGKVILRTRRNKQLPEDLKHLLQYRSNNYGESTLHYYMRDKQSGDKSIE